MITISDNYNEYSYWERKNLQSLGAWLATLGLKTTAISRGDLQSSGLSQFFILCINDIVWCIVKQTFIQHSLPRVIKLLH